jgi:UDP-N-acetylglucosamine:LPS N-acetylglucosamine transferase
LKVLVVCSPGAGHVGPLLPLVEALLAGGDRVVVCAGDDPGGAVSRSGAEFRAAGHGEMDWFGVLQARVRGFPGDGLAPERINHYFVPRVFGEIATADMIDDVLACGRDLEPDVVLFETYALAGPLAAELLGVPAVHHLISPMLPREVLELTNDAVSPLWRSFERDAPGYAGVYRGVTIEITPSSLETQQLASGERLAMRPTPPPPAKTAPSIPPLVYVTLGTAFANVEIFRAALNGLADEPVGVVLTVGPDQDPAALAPPPANARVERFIPQADLLPRCSAVVHHGGSGTMLGSFAHGLPQVVVPQGADNFINAGLITRAGAGFTLGPGEVSPESIRHAVRSVLDEPSYATAARRIAAEIVALPSPAEVADTLRRRFDGNPTGC